MHPALVEQLLRSHHDDLTRAVARQELLRQTSGRSGPIRKALGAAVVRAGYRLQGSAAVAPQLR